MGANIDDYHDDYDVTPAAGSVAGLVGDKLDANVSGVAKAVWDYATSMATIAGSMGAYILSKLGLVTVDNVNVVVSNPVSLDLNITVVQGDAYDSITGQPITFTDSGTWPDLAGHTIKLTIATQIELTIVATSTCSVAPGPPQIISAPLTAAQTAALTPGVAYVYDIRTQLGTGEIRTLIAASQVIVNQPITATW
jgi:hypothetical protein